MHKGNAVPIERVRVEVAWATVGPEEGGRRRHHNEGCRAQRRPAQPTTPSAPATRWAKMGVEEKRSAPEEAMEEEEWAPGQVVRKVGGQDGSWLFLFGCGFLLFFLTGGWGLGRSGAREEAI